MTDVPERADVPERLLTTQQWVCWRTEERDGKATKIPIDPSSGSFASTTDPETWAGFETACEQVAFGDADGVGFVFTDDDAVVGVDLDDCRVPETESTMDWASDVIDQLNSYTEVSPSGTGFHVLVAGSMPDGRNRRGDIEIYETSRFFTVTGDHVEGTSEEVRERTAALASVYDEYVAEDDDGRGSEAVDSAGRDGPGDLDDAELLERAKRAANGEKFRRLYRGDTSGYESHSEADMALCSILAFWTGGDPGRMDRLFRDSGLMREKWDEVHYADGSTYGEKTIERAVAGTDEFYEPGEDASSGAAQEMERVLDPSVVRDREAARLERIEELQAQLREVLAEKEELEAELAEERARRQELERGLDERDSSGSIVPFW